MYVSMRKYHHKVTENEIGAALQSFLEKITFLKSVHENEKDERYLSFVVFSLNIFVWEVFPVLSVFSQEFNKLSISL